MDRPLATGIQGAAHLVAFDDLAKQRFESLDLSSILMFVIDTAPASALPFLASQFNVLGWRGWNIATTESDKRELLKKAIELNRRKGTVWAIKEACKSVGFEDAEVIEGVGVDYDGTYNHDSSITYGSGANWFNFRVIIQIGSDVEINQSSNQNVRELILAYKNARSILTDISYRLIFSDQLTINDEFLDLDGDLIVDTIGPGITHNGIHSYNGDNLYDNRPDIIDLTIFKNNQIIENDTF